MNENEVVMINPGDEGYDEFIHNLGKPQHFNIDKYLDAVEEMIQSDEIIFALEMIDNLPGWYRENPPSRALEIKRIVNRQVMSVFDYAQDSDESTIAGAEKIDCLHCYPRGPIINQLVEQLNQQDQIPHVVEFGPADFWLYSGLKGKNRSFTYQYVSLNQSAQIKSEEPNPIGPRIFVCCEVIEHLWRPEDVKHSYDKIFFEKGADFVVLSTPLNTLFGGMADWKNRSLGHIRTYTKDEFLSFAKANWPEFHWTLYLTPMMVLLGKRDPDEPRKKQK